MDQSIVLLCSTMLQSEFGASQTEFAKQQLTLTRKTKSPVLVCVTPSSDSHTCWPLSALSNNRTIDGFTLDFSFTHSKLVVSESDGHSMRALPEWRWRQCTVSRESSACMKSKVSLIKQRGDAREIPTGHGELFRPVHYTSSLTGDRSSQGMHRVQGFASLTGVILDDA